MSNLLKPILYLLLVVLSLTSYAQELTKIKGKVIDANTKQPMPFVNIQFIGANIGTTTDFDGNYYIETQWATSKILASFISYKIDTVKIQKGKTQTINFSLKESSVLMQEFTIVGEKQKYRNKDNPAVELIKNVIDHKNKNRKQAMDFYQYEKYEKIEIDLNNITEKFLNQGWLKKNFQVVLDNIDTSEINGKPFLPIYLRETASEVYYKKNPKTEKEYQNGIKQTGFEGYVDEDGMSFLIDKLYQNVDIYDNDINLLSNQFTSPISNIAPTIYKYFIIDTTDINGVSAINLAFTPRNTADFAFIGNLYIKNDSSFNIIKVSLSVPQQININFVKDFSLEQEFEPYKNDSVWMVSKENLVIDYNFTQKSRGFFGKKTVYYNNILFDKPQPDSIYNPLEKLIKDENSALKTDSFWLAARPDTLSKSERSVYFMIDSIQHIKSFKRFMDVAFLFITGWQPLGKIEIGPIGTFYSFNDVEGLKIRGGFRTTPKFIDNMMFESFLAYGFGDKKYKYFGGYTYSFNKNYLTNPQHRITTSYQHETNFPGQDLQFVNDGNFLLSFRRGNSNRMLFTDTYSLDYIHESTSGFSYNLIYENKIQQPLGILNFTSSDTNNKAPINNIKVDNFSVNLRFAPNEQFYQGKNFRLPIRNKYPIFQLRYTQGVSGFINGDINYSRLNANITKRFYLSIIGVSDVELEAGKIFGKVPFPLLNLPLANQSYFLQETAFNLMNFMEFMSDEYASLKITHDFNGVIFNRIPLFKRLKLREIASLKLLYGRLTNENNPDIQKDLFLFPVNKKNESITYQFKNGIPYAEASVGISNIFKIFRLDLVQRLTYLENQEVSSMFGVRGLSIRAKGTLDF